MAEVSPDGLRPQGKNGPGGQNRRRFQATASVDGRRYATAAPGYMDLQGTYGMAFQLQGGSPIPESSPIAATWTLAAVAGWITRQRRRTARQALPSILHG